MTATKEEIKTLENILDNLYTEKLIKLSKMVTANKISEGNARVVFKDIRKWFNYIQSKIEALYD